MEKHDELDFLRINVESWRYPAAVLLSFSAAYTLPVLGWLRSLSHTPPPPPSPPPAPRRLGLRLLPPKPCNPT